MMRFELKGLLMGVGYNHHVDAYDDEQAAVDAAMAKWGYDRIFVIDTKAGGAVVWDSAEPEKRTSSAPFADMAQTPKRDKALDQWVRAGSR